ncbi:hypothetical protein GDO81_016012 [Engystomops pustulosus]|uniref:Uncharacterized protein n=1 Tax=Engystomops pustulosus TaxID=76066 RepID=A0AAV7AWX9_ENGPU|nr:hypothetical protein GDO81_016012 [Engystomops pustulosus]
MEVVGLHLNEAVSPCTDAMGQSAVKFIKPRQLTASARKNNLSALNVPGPVHSPFIVKCVFTR